jgi:hypothetical protein
MVLHAGTEAVEGATLTKATVADGGGVGEFDPGFAGVFDDGFGGCEALPLGFVESAVFVDCTALASEPVPLPHPKPQKARVIRKIKNRKNGKLCG